jgi:cytochrome c5
MRNLIGTLVLAAILSGCGGSGIPADGNIQTSEDPAEGGISEVPNPNAAMAAKSGTPLPALQRGHETYMLKCGECHNYMIPKDLDVDEWEDAMPKMIRHAGLAPDDEKAVLAYVLAVKGE